MLAYPGVHVLDIQTGQSINNSALMAEFSIGISGGMRKSNAKNCLVIVSDHTKGTYDDRWEGDVLHYTGMGLRGPQALDYGQNYTLLHSKANGVNVHLFEVFDEGKYIYAGEVDLCAEPYQENQIDQDGADRLVWMFPVKLRPGGLRPTPMMSSLQKLQKLKEKALSTRPIAEIKKQALNASATPNQRRAFGIQFIRNPAVATYVKLAAGGNCDLCQKPAPFEKNGEPFLHCHHVVWLARGGPDIIQNTVAICPNCHERMHQLDQRSDVKRLATRIQQRDPDLPAFDIIGFKPEVMSSELAHGATTTSLAVTS